MRVPVFKLTLSQLANDHKEKGNIVLAYDLVARLPFLSINMKEKEKKLKSLL